MTGGLRRDEGCSGPSWLVTCCLPQVTRSDGDSLPRQEARLPSLPQQLVSSSSLQGSSTSSLPQQLHYGGIRSSSGTGSFQLSNTLEEIANLGMNECKPSMIDSRLIEFTIDIRNVELLSHDYTKVRSFSIT